MSTLSLSRTSHFLFPISKEKYLNFEGSGDIVLTWSGVQVCEWERRRLNVGNTQHTYDVAVAYQSARNNSASLSL